MFKISNKSVQKKKVKSYSNNHDLSKCKYKTDIWSNLEAITLIGFFFSELFGTKVSFSQPIQEIKKLSSFITKECRLRTLSSSFANELLCCVNFDDIILEIESLSREVILNKTIETTEDNDEHGKVYVAEVTVTCEKSELNVNQKVKCTFSSQGFLIRSATPKPLTEQKRYMRVYNASSSESTYFQNFVTSCSDQSQKMWLKQKK